MAEASFLADVRLALGQRPDIFMIRINTGNYLPIDWRPGMPKRVIESAPAGTPDLLGVQRIEARTAPGIGATPMPGYIGRAFAIECKFGKGKQREAQKNWQAAWERRGGLYILAYSMADVFSGLGIEQ